MSKVIGIVGSRGRDGQAAFRKVSLKFHEIYEDGDTICSGLCPKGADRFAVRLAEINHIDKVLWFQPDWQTHGRAAGFIRNGQIAEASGVLIACVASNRKGGTEDTIRKFIKAHGDEKLHIIETGRILS